MAAAGTATASATSVAAVEMVAPTSLSTTTALGIYPNPVISDFQLQVNNELTGQMMVQVYSMSGALQKQFAINKAAAGSVRHSISVGALSPGNYIVKVTMNNWTQSKQINKR